jgi:hypothetical protein
MACCSDGKAESRNDLRHLGGLSDFGLEAGASEQQIDDDVLVADWTR